MVDILKLRKMKGEPASKAKPEPVAPEQLAPEEVFESKSDSETPIQVDPVPELIIESSTPVAPKPEEGTDEPIEVTINAAIESNREENAVDEIEQNKTSADSVSSKSQAVTDGARDSAKSEEDLKVIDLVIFTLANRLFGVDISKVQEVVRFTEITRVPNAADFVLGVMNLRGNITPVIDLHKRFSLPEATWSDKTRIIVLQIHGQAIGFLVDHVSEIMHALESDIDSASAVHSGIGTDYISGVVKIRSRKVDQDENKLLILLNLENILEDGTVTLN